MKNQYGNFLKLFAVAALLVSFSLDGTNFSDSEPFIRNQNPNATSFIIYGGFSCRGTESIYLLREANETDLYKIALERIRNRYDMNNVNLLVACFSNMNQVRYFHQTGEQTSAVRSVRASQFEAHVAAPLINNSKKHVYMVGSSLGSWSALRTLDFVTESAERDLFVVTIDPVDRDYCKPPKFLANRAVNATNFYLGTSIPVLAGCKSFMNDHLQKIVSANHKKTTQWLNFYEDQSWTVTGPKFPEAHQNIYVAFEELDIEYGHRNIDVSDAVWTHLDKAWFSH